MSLNIGSNIISPTQINNVINNQSNINVTPTKSVQTIIPQQEIFSTNIQCTQGINGTVLIANIDASFLEYGKSYQVTAPRIRYTGNIHSNNGLFNILSINTIWTASEDGEINFTLTDNSNTPLAGRITLSKTQIKVYFQNNGGANGGILGYYNNVDTITFSSVDPYDGINQVTIEPIPSDYIIPEGTLTISAPGIVNAASYASVSIPGMTNPTWTTAALTSSTGKINYSFNIMSGFKSTSQVYTNSIILPSTTGTTIIPSEISQIAVNSYQWTKGSIIVDAIPNSIGIYQKIVKKTVTVDELNVFFSTQTSIPCYAFYSNKSLSGILNLGTVNTIGSSAFAYCTKITDLIGPNVIEISSYALSGLSLNTISLPKVKKISIGFNQNGKTLSSVYFPELISANFSYCNAVSFYDLPKISYLSSYFFYQNYALTSINLSSVSFISGNSVFCLCGKLTNIYLPNLTLLSNATAFISGCGNLITISFPKLTNITGGNVFNSCAKLTSLYLMNSSIIQVSTSSFIGTNSPFLNSSYLSGNYASIYVPSSLVNDYKTHSIWSWFSARFVGV